MKKQLTITAAVALILSATTACDMWEHEKVHNMEPGKYERNTTSTDSNGTTYKTKNSTVVKEDSNGNKKAVVESKTTKDPKGLFNKETVSKNKEMIKDEEY